MKCEQIGLLVDKYQLTMAQTYFKNNRMKHTACFDYFFRKLPFENGYLVFAGLQDLLEMLVDLRFDERDARFLIDEGFDRQFVDYLRQFRFKGTIYAMREGEVAFPVEPLLRIEGNLIETQIAETLVLNILNFQSLIATKAARVRYAAGERTVSDFGLRRAHGLGGIHASRAAVIGGCDSTSNMLAAFHYDLKAVGTMAHSFVQSFEDELSAFREYARFNPDSCVLLVDTYDTLKSGLPNAVKVARELEAKGHRLVGIRIDSGDLAYLSKKARQMLDQAGLDYVRIAVSNQLDEFVIRSLIEQKAPIDFFGVGTRLITGQPDAALDGVYKLSLFDSRPRMKISDTLIKSTLPGKKRVLRYSNGEGGFLADAIVLDDEQQIDCMYHPFEKEKRFKVAGLHQEDLFIKVMENGEIIMERESVEQIARRVRERLKMLPAEHKRFEYPHIYKVGVSKRLMDLRDSIVKQFRRED
ncbi:nicotinate phosphoribosyltransferase [Caldithrix abyssi DSM 13497]|uniref:Nicotinate phosphoribosyltransferase n=1 Tax=Caldithrix abyssi DSM 13497 TaxID=880073 RepID=H1XW43_CALAY|nr:nicotinate phosphoribosyltransferase [Caldithrix abyssi]APF17736.1 nicotinate phosphoribosyltransferase [Caldithrix abyssi DSM 13497]EHO41815.1 nicotinate phosphoribosyltransferase [Caldithrix abyssi DSM 13497]